MTSTLISQSGACSLEDCSARMSAPDVMYDAADAGMAELQHAIAEADTKSEAISPMVFPTGAALLGTTIRRIRRLEGESPFEFDAVCRCAVHPGRVSFPELCRIIGARLAAAPAFTGRVVLERFHFRVAFDGFDVRLVPATHTGLIALPSWIMLPACPADEQYLRGLQSWTLSDPLRFAAWFQTQCAVVPRDAALLCRSSAAAAPPFEGFRAAAPLKDVLRILLRERDAAFLNDTCRPSFALLATLAGHSYRGESDLHGSLASVLDGAIALLDRGHGRKVPITDPSVSGIDLTWALTTDAFAKLIQVLQRLRERFA